MAPQDKEAILVGEANPYGGNPYYALYPEPAHSAGGRLCRIILGLTVSEYLRRFDRVNLCTGKWNPKEARQVAGTGPRWNNGVVILLGSKVCGAFGVPFNPFTLGTDCRELVILPHPSGLCRIWQQPDAVLKARMVLADAGITLPDL